MFQNKCLVPAKPPGADAVDLKATKWKKLGKFLKAMEKEKKLVKVTDKKGVQYVAAVHRSCAAYVAFEAHDLATASKVGKAVAAAAPPKPPPSTAPVAVRVLELYTVSPEVRRTIPAADVVRGALGEYLTAAECKPIIAGYFAKEGLDCPQRPESYFLPDGPLCDLLCVHRAPLLRRLPLPTHAPRLSSPPLPGTSRTRKTSARASPTATPRGPPRRTRSSGSSGRCSRRTPCRSPGPRRPPPGGSCGRARSRG